MYIHMYTRILRVSTPTPSVGSPSLPPSFIASIPVLVLGLGGETCLNNHRLSRQCTSPTPCHHLLSLRHPSQRC